jgi:hypothetical protein
MKLRAWPYVSVLPLIVVLCGCGSHRPPTGPRPPFTVAGFPLTVGTQWTYRVVDSLLDIVDTVEVRIDRLSDSTPSSQTWVWVYTSHRGLISRPDRRVTLVGDTVYMRDEDRSKSFLKIVYPLEVENTWWNGAYECAVVAESTITVPCGAFRTYRMETVLHSPCLNCFLTFDHWLVRNVGIVRMRRVEGDLVANSLEVWELIGCRIGPPS